MSDKRDIFDLAYIGILEKSHLVVLTFVSFGTRDVNSIRTTFPSHLLLYFPLKANFCSILSKRYWYLSKRYRWYSEAIGNSELHSCVLLAKEKQFLFFQLEFNKSW